MGKNNYLKIALLFTLGTMLITNEIKTQNYPSIKINGNEILVSDISKFPCWLNANQTLEVGANAKFISVLQYNISPTVSGSNDLLFDSIVTVTSSKIVPNNKAWKIEYVGLDMSAAVIGATGPTGVTGPIGNTGPIGPTGIGGFTHYIGEEKDGGIIFYLYKDGNGDEHGLIVSKIEQVNTKWQNTGIQVNADRSWDGAYNTNLMTDSPAKDWIDNNLNISGVTGWYIPSMVELQLLWNNLIHVNNALITGGHLILSNNFYWSSQEYNVTYAGALWFIFGYSGSSYYSKTNEYTVRGIRAF